MADTTQETCPLCGCAFDERYATREVCDVCGRDYLDTAGASMLICQRCMQEHD